MKQGLSLQELAAKLDQQNKAKRDFLVDTRELTMLAGVAQEDGEGKPVFTAPELHLPDGAGEFELRTGSVANRQIGDHLKIPAPYWDMLRADHPGLLSTSVNTLLREREPGKRMLRTYDYGETDRYARAFLSDRYLRRDNQQVAEAALKVLAELPEVSIPSAQVTDKHMHLTAVAPRVQGEVKKDDIVQAGIRIRNSEVGWGALVVEPILWRLWCLNGCTTGEVTRTFRIVHSGPQIDSEETLRVLSDETLQKDDEAFFAKLADVMRAAVDETIFNDALVQMRLAADSKPMVQPVTAMEELGRTLKLGEGEQESILNHLIQGGDLTAYGALNAITRAAHDVESYDRSMELEQAGGKVLAMAGTRQWERIAALTE